MCRNRTPCDGKDDNHLGRSTDTTIGVSVEHYSVTFSYSGKLLAEAHRIDPNSGFRSHTLFSTVLDYSDPTDDWDLPNFNAARAYLREFPKGPFAPDAAMVLAGAYKDAYWGLHLDQSEMEIDSYACVADQLGDLKDKSRSAQETYAKKMAESYFRQAFRLRKPNQEQRYWYDNWRRGHPTYDYCPD